MSEARLAVAAELKALGDELGAAFLMSSPDLPLVEWVRDQLEAGEDPYAVLKLIQDVMASLTYTILSEAQHGKE